MARERWPKALRSSGANQRALRSVSGVFLVVIGAPVRDRQRSSHRPRMFGKPLFVPTARRRRCHRRSQSTCASLVKTDSGTSERSRSENFASAANRNREAAFVTLSFAVQTNVKY